MSFLPTYSKKYCLLAFTSLNTALIPNTYISQCTTIPHKLQKQKCKKLYAATTSKYHVIFKSLMLHNKTVSFCIYTILRAIILDKEHTYQSKNYIILKKVLRHRLRKIVLIILLLTNYYLQPCWGLVK